MMCFYWIWIFLQDLFFLHERGSKMGVYIVFLAWGNSLGPLAGGFFIAGKLSIL